MELLKKFILDAPEKPGIYKMYDANNELIYVGKAKNIKKRISQYLKPLSDRMQQAIYKLAKIEFIVTKNEIEALIVEAENIKKLQPKYNILLKDDKSYPFIKITDHAFPRIIKYRGIRTKGCYGPFISAMDIKQTILSLQKTFLIRSCSDNFFHSRKKPCLEYQIKRCSAPCVNKITHEEYKQAISDVKNVLMGNVKKIQSTLVDSMQKASEKMEYELAASYRDRLRILQNLHTISQNQIYNTENCDYIGIYTKNNKCAINIISYRITTGFGNYNFYFEINNQESESELIEQFLLQFYIENNNLPQNIFLNFTIKREILEALNELSKKSIKIEIPKISAQIETLQLAMTKAEKYLNDQFFKEEKIIKCFKKIQEYFHLIKLPQTIEAYDNSHSFGQFAVGSMITVNTQGFDKNSYRHFKIKENNTGNDHKMMEEVLTRRFKNIKTLPDFILIDGGRGHIQMVKKIIGDIPFVCITKGDGRKAENDHFYSSDGKIFHIQDTELLYFLQNIRNEAHRSAIQFYRKMHTKSYTKSTIDDIPGIGNTRKKILLTYFKNIDELKNSKIDDLAKIKGIGKNIAQKICSFLNNEFKIPTNITKESEKKDLK